MFLGLLKDNSDLSLDDLLSLLHLFLQFVDLNLDFVVNDDTFDLFLHNDFNVDNVFLGLFGFLL